MKYQVYFGIAIRIVILFGVGMLWTFISPQLREFLGDTYCGQQNCSGSSFDSYWIWGARHYWYFWMMFLLFLLSTVNVVMGIINLFEKHYPSKY